MSVPDMQRTWMGQQAGSVDGKRANIGLAAAIKKIKAEDLAFNESWHTLAARCARVNPLPAR